MTINTTLTLILGIICYIVLPFLVLLFVKNDKRLKVITIVLLCLYLVILLIGVWGEIDVNRHNITINFDFSGKFCSKKINFNFKNLTTFDILINLFMLIPIGMAIAFLKKTSYLKSLLIFALVGLICGFAIELTQFILPIQRSVQLSDVIFNMISVLIGGIIGKLYLILLKK